MSSSRIDWPVGRGKPISTTAHPDSNRTPRPTREISADSRRRLQCGSRERQFALSPFAEEPEQSSASPRSRQWPSPGMRNEWIAFRHEHLSGQCRRQLFPKRIPGVLPIHDPPDALPDFGNLRVGAARTGRGVKILLDECVRGRCTGCLSATTGSDPFGTVARWVNRRNARQALSARRFADFDWLFTIP